MLNLYTLEQAERWDSIVRGFNSYDIYWLSGYVKAFKLHGDGEPLLFHYDDGRTRGINVVMKRDIALDVQFNNLIEKDRYYDFATPYGYGGWIIEGEETDNLFHAYSNWIEKNDIISEFVRFHPLVKNQDVCSAFYTVISLGEVVHMDLDSPGMIWENMTSKNRNMIRKSIKNEVKVYNSRFPSIYEKFRVIYNKTMDKDDAEKYYYFEPDFYKSILDDLPDNAQIFWAEIDNEVIAASIIFATNGRMNYHLSGSLREYGSLAATNLILYKAALWGCENGCKTFYLGGGLGSSEDSLFKFKRAFYRGNLNHFYIGKKIYNKEKYDELVKMRGSIDSSFFPLYRAKKSKIV